MKLVNKKALHNFSVIEEFVAGLVLLGSEVKSLRMGNCNFGEAYVIFKDGELFIKGMHISKLKFASYFNHEELREKKILLKKREIDKISKLMQVKGNTLIPIELFLSHGRFKMKVAVCKGKKLWDKREDLKKKDIERELRRKNF